MTAIKTLRHALDAVLLIMVICAISLAALTAMPAALGMSTYAVRSPSMSPTIPLGSLVIVDGSVQGDEVRAEDVIAFPISGTDENVCVHRAKRIDQKGGLIETQGDANETLDPRSVSFEEVTGVVCVHIPCIGFVLTWAAAHRLLLVALAAALAFASAALALVTSAQRTGLKEKGRECPNKAMQHPREA